MIDHDVHSPVPVVIVGAGPVGLSLALGLARHGVRSMLVEKNPSTSEKSKAPGIHVRTREIFRQWGVEQRFLDAGVLRETVEVNSVTAGQASKAQPLFAFDFSHLVDEADRPGIMVLEQGKTEKLLLEAVRESGRCDVRFGTEAVAVEQDRRAAAVTIRDADGERTISAQFVVGCDGAGSFVREALGQPFDGITYSMRPMLADVRIDDRRDSLPWPRLFNGRGGLTIGIRLEAGLWRLIRLESTRNKDDEVPEREVGRRMAEVLGDGPFDIQWANRFRIHRRSSPRFRVGRVLLAGDAAHIHSPVGGQGMNAGIQDAHNLAWKLAASLSGSDAEALLDSYDVERRAVVVGSVSRYTDFLTRALLLPPPPVRATAFFLLRTMLRWPRLRTRMFRRTTMINLGYPASPILDARLRSAGARLPNVRLRSPDGKEVRIYDLLPCGPTILDVADHREFAEELPVEHVLRIGPGGYRDAAGLLRRLLHGKDGWILVRPDAHVAWARDQREGLDDAVRFALGRRSPPDD